MLSLLLLFAAGFCAGVLNSMAGGGSFLTFPALVFAGVPAVAANASSTIALVPASFASTFSYREDLQSLKGIHFMKWLVVSLIGGIVGSVLLLRTPETTFLKIAPWLLLFATVVFAFGRQFSAAMKGRFHSSPALILPLMFVISIYGGYFGGGMGIMVLAALTLYGLTEIHAMNGMKTVLGGSLNTMAAIVFIMARQVYWRQSLWMMSGAIAGGYLGASWARKIPAAGVRLTVILVGVTMTIYFFVKAPK